MVKALGLRAADLARLLDVTPETISHWETDKARPSRAAFVAIGALVQETIDGRTTTRDRLATLSGGRTYPRAFSVKLT
jgi:DNA-binding XRE family transcriptional regulator